MVHYGHDSILVPPFGVFYALDLTPHHDDLPSGDKLSTGIGRSKVLGNTCLSNVTIESLCKAVDHLSPLSWAQNIWWAGGQDKVAIEVNDQSIGWRSEQGAALSSHPKNIGTGFLDKLLDVTGMHHWVVKATPFVNAHKIADGLGSDGQDSRIVRDKDYAAGWGNSSLDDTNNVRNRETAEEWPHGKVLEASGRRWKLVAQSVVLHVDTDQVIQAWSWEAENTRNLFSMEQVSGLVPMNPHAPEVVAQQVVQGISRQETKAVWDPVGFIGIVIEIWFCLLAKLPDGLCTLLIRTGPDPECDTVEGV